MKNLSTISLLLALLLFASCEEGGLLIEPDISSGTVTVIAPTEGSDVEGTTVFFDWEPLEDADTYQVQVASPDFENTGQLLLNTEDSVTVAQLELTVGQYQWRVRARNSGYETPYTTASFRVVPVENFSDNLVILDSPEDGLVTNVPGQSLIWQDVEGATIYRVQVLLDGQLQEETTTDTANMDVTFPEGDCAWRVRAENGLESTLYSVRSLLLDVTPPNAPVLTSPADGQELGSGDVSLEWSREALEGSTEADSIFVYRDAGLQDLVISGAATSPYSISLDNGTYHWLVRASDQAGNQGDASDTFSFTVNGP